jgi:Cdc6-like AAA superfamily ATPase|tara:strand:- start:120 stop:434 length:315 start_codon:yes stop_codon:yes gene_type:complete
MLKFLYFANSLDDAACMPFNLLRAMKADGNSDGITFEFKDVQDGIGTEVSMKIKTTQNKNKEVMSAITDSIRKSKKPFIVIADEINNEFVHPDVIEVESDISIT